MSVVNGNRQAALFAVEAEGPFAGVVFNRPLDAVFTYRIPSRLQGLLRPGQRVRVPLGRGNTEAVGYCVAIEPTATIEPGRVKDLIAVLDDLPLIDPAMLELTRWMAGYYACSWGQALDAVVPSGVKTGAGTRIMTCLMIPEEAYEALPPDLSAKQSEVLSVLARSKVPLTVADVCRLAKCGSGPIATLRQRGLVRAVKRRLNTATLAASDASEMPCEAAATSREPLVLTDEQTAVLDRLAPALPADAFATFLLHGVTGSGKTEVYLSAIEQVVARGREAIVLVPEISLTPQTIRRFRSRFSQVAVLHSHLSDAERHRHWRSIASGAVQVVVGARSAIFAPTQRLGLIVIDEEHESTFKQETTPRYHARDVAVKRAQMLGVPVILGSATPSLESWRNAELGRYQRLTLSKRVNGRPMPEVGLIDLRSEKPPPSQALSALSTPLREAIGQTLDDAGQVILFLNRRGFHTFVICPKCGHVLKCHACDIALTHHKGRQCLLCHTCDAERPLPTSCPSCRASRLYYGGIGTERLEREVKAAFPDHVVRRMDSDTMRTPGSHEQVLSAFRAGEVHILLGTQMIAKGLDFPNVTLVGVVNADTALHLPDFRAAERTFQLVAQVAGRTGRGDRPGRVLVQTFTPEHPAIRFASHHDYEGFLAVELPQRERAGVPPFGRIVRLIGRGPDETAIEHYMNDVASLISELMPEDVRLLGPAPAPVMKIRHLFRFQIQLRAPSARPLQALVRRLRPRLAPPSGIELAIDVDPLSLL